MLLLGFALLLLHSLLLLLLILLLPDLPDRVSSHVAAAVVPAAVRLLRLRLVAAVVPATVVPLTSIRESVVERECGPAVGLAVIVDSEIKMIQLLTAVP